MPNSTVNHDAVVVESTGDRRVVLNKGKKDGIKDSDKFVVFSLGEEMFDPNTNESLGVLEDVKGRGRVIHLQKNMCTIETYEFDTEEIPSGLIGFTRREREYRIFEFAEKGDFARKLPRKLRWSL